MGCRHVRLHLLATTWTASCSRSPPEHCVYGFPRRLPHATRLIRQTRGPCCTLPLCLPPPSLSCSLRDGVQSVLPPPAEFFGPGDNSPRIRLRALRLPRVALRPLPRRRQASPARRITPSLGVCLFRRRVRTGASQPRPSSFALPARVLLKVTLFRSLAVLSWAILPAPNGAVSNLAVSRIEGRPNARSATCIPWHTNIRPTDALAPSSRQSRSRVAR